EPPPEGVICLNTDGALTNTGAGYGGVYRDSEGKVKLAFCSSTKGSDITTIELEAITTGMQIALAQGYCKVRLLSDSKQAVDFINVEGSKHLGDHEGLLDKQRLLCRDFKG
ncbi:hypothetical protein FRX31_025662, partial [Thalictrum thalictroides]